MEADVCFVRFFPQISLIPQIEKCGRGDTSMVEVRKPITGWGQLLPTKL